MTDRAVEYASVGIDEEENVKTIGEYLSALRRRRVQIMVVAGVLAAIAAVVAVALPAMYRSTATILVQEQEIPPELVRSTITSYADERIQVISQQVMTRAALLQLIDKYGLYEKYRQRATSDELVDRMRKDIKLTTVNADISDRNSGRRANATIAFTISYDAPQPDRAQQVVNDLVSRYLDENVKVREQSVAETTAFLSQEADRLAAQIQEIESNLALFKRRNAGRLPDSSPVNMQLADRTGSEMLRIEREISTLQERKLALEAQLPLIPPRIALASTATDRGLPPEDRLRTLQAQYATASAVYGADHPDIRRMRREIAALSGETSTSGEDGNTAEKLQTLESQLASLKERYSDDHPDIQRIRRSIAALKATPSKQTSTSGSEPQPAPRPAQRPDNPAYVVLLTQIEGTKRELNQLAAQRDDLRAQQRTYDARLQQIPEIEREYHDLTRDYENAQTRYREVKAKQMQAQVSQELEKDRKAERFSLGEPANMPERPFSPNRPVVALVGLFLALGSSLGIAGLRETFDTSVKGPLELARIATVPILVAIPYIETRWELVGKRRRMWAMLGMVLLLSIAFLLAVNFAVRPLPALWDSLARKLIFW